MKERVTKEVFELMVSYYGKGQQGIRTMAKLLSSDEESVRKAIGKISKEKKGRARKEKKKEPTHASVVRFANMLPCNQCIWGQRVSDVKFFCAFGRCVKEEKQSTELKGA